MIEVTANDIEQDSRLSRNQVLHAIRSMEGGLDLLIDIFRHESRKNPRDFQCKEESFCLKYLHKFLKESMMVQFGSGVYLNLRLRSKDYQKKPIGPLT